MSVEVAAAEVADAVAPALRASRNKHAASDPALELIEEILVEEIYREQGSRFRRVAAAIVESAEAAEDVVQEASRARWPSRAPFAAREPRRRGSGGSSSTARSAAGGAEPSSAG